MRQIGLNLVLEIRLRLIPRVDTHAIGIALHLLPLNVDSFDRGHREKKVFDQERFLDVNWEVAKVLGSLFHPPRRLGVLYKACILRRDIVVVQVRPLKEPVWQLGNRCFDHFEDAGVRHFGPVRRNQIIGLCLHLEKVTKGGLEADVIKWSHFFAVCHLSGIQNGPLCQLRNTVAAFFIPLVLLDSHLSAPLESKEEALCCLKADRGAESDWLATVTVFEVQNCQLFTLTDFKV